MQPKAPNRTAKAAAVTGNLGLINGISRTGESRLHQAGIATYAQLSALDPEKIAKIVKVPAALIEQQNWTGQARKLASLEAAANETPKRDLPSSGELRNEGFVVDLFVDDRRNVVTTQVLHVKSNDGESWSGWDGGQLSRFFAKHAGAALQGPEEHQPDAVAGAQPATPAAEPGKSELSKLTLEDVTITPEGAAAPSQVVAGSRPFDVTLSVRISGSPGEGGLAYTACVHARRVGEGSRVVLAERKGQIRKVQDTIQLRVPGRKLVQGSYSLTTYLILSGPDNRPLPNLAAHSLATRSLTVSEVAV